MLTMFGKEAFSEYELPFPASYPAFTPLHLFFVLNLLIISIIVITQHCYRETSLAMQEVHVLRHAQSLLLSMASSCFHHEDPQYAENELQRPMETQATGTAHDKTIFPVEEKAQLPHPRETIEKFEFDPARSHQQQQESNEVLFSLDHQEQNKGKMGVGDDEEEKNGAADSFDMQKCAEKQFWGLKQERPLASAHFPFKKIVTRLHTCKSPGKISRSSATRKGDTLDATWKAICEDKSRHSSPLRHHRALANRTRKMDTSCKSKELSMSPLKPRQSSSHSLVMRRRERSMTKDELHVRVESFISTFKEQIKIQRQQSLLGYEELLGKSPK